MFWDQTKRSRRIAVAAALGLTVSCHAASSGPASAFDDDNLEERVAELEATTVRKGNKRVSLTLSGWVTKSANWWDDGEESNMYVGDKGTTLSSHFQLSGSAKINVDWSGGYTTSIEAPGVAFGFLANQINDDTEGGLISTVTGNANVNTLLSYWWVKSEQLGTLNVGLLSQATDNVALLPDLSGTIIESNAVFFEGVGFYLRPKGVEKNETGMLAHTKWEAFLWCETTNLGIGADCNGVPQNAIRYDSPTLAGFSVSASWGEDDMWDVAARYAGEFGGFKVAGAAGYTRREDERGIFGGGGLAGFKEDTDLFQTGASVLHVPTGVFVYGLYQNENASPDPNLAAAQAPVAAGSDNETDVWYVKAGITKDWLGIGNTVLYGEYGEYHNQYGDLKGIPLCASGRFTTFGGQFTPSCVTALGLGEDLILTGSQVDRWGLGVVQELDAAAMHLYIRYQHQDLDTDLKTTITGQRVGQGWESWGLVQAGGVIFF